MLSLRIRTALRCPKHPRFSPARGRGAVKAGCPACQDLCTINELAATLRNKIGYFQQDYVPAVEGPTPAADEQAPDRVA